MKCKIPEEITDAGKNVISLHKPYPGQILKSYQIDDIIRFLEEKGHINSNDKHT